MTKGQIILGRVFGALILFLATSAVAFLVIAAVTLNPMFALVGLSAALGCVGMVGIAAAVFDSHQLEKGRKT